MRSLVIIPLLLAACADTTAPEWPEAAELTADVEAERVRLSWPSSVDDDALVYVVNVDGEERSRMTTDTHSFMVTTLEDETTYVLEVTAMDESGNVSAPLSSIIRTLDGTPPEWPDGAELVATSASPADAEPRAVRLSWPGPVDAVRYRVFRDEGHLAWTETLSYQTEEAPLLAETVFEVRAIDSADNESEGLVVVWGETDQARREAEEPDEADDAVRPRLLGSLGAIQSDSRLADALSAQGGDLNNAIQELSMEEGVGTATPIGSATVERPAGEAN